MNPFDEEARMWRDALQTDAPACEPVDPDTVWKAVAGELSADELGPLVDRLATDPDLQQAWRLAQQMQRNNVADAPVVPRPANRMWFAIAVVAACVVLAVLLLPRAQDDTVRGDDAITTPLTDRAEVPRNHAVLRWDHPDGAVATVTVRDVTLAVLATSPEQSAGVWQVPETSLQPIADGELIVWQVRVVQDGVTTTSPAFVQRVGGPR